MKLILASQWVIDVIYWIMSLLYNLIMFFADLLNLIQDLFRKMAGIEPFYYAGGVEGGDLDIITRLLTSDVIKNALISIMILAVILLIMFTIFALVKQQYSVQPTPTAEIIGRSIRALFGFLFIPILCIGGVYLGNIVLKGIDAATAASNSPTISGQIFASSSYDANWLRKDLTNEQKQSLIGFYQSLTTTNGKTVFVGLKDKTFDTEAKFEEAANIIDKAIAANFPNLTIGDRFVLNYSQAKNSFSGDLLKSFNGSTTQATLHYTKTNNIKPMYSYRLRTGYFYDIQDINYLFLIVGIVFTAYALCIITFGVIKRIFSLTILFMISPAMLALYPLDNGNAIGQWKTKFIADTITAYAAVGVFNLFLQVLSLIDGLQIYDPTKPLNSLFNSVINLIIMIVGCFVVTQIISQISGLIGASDAFAEGKSASGEATKKLKDIKEAPGKFVQKVGGAVAKGVDVFQRFGKGGFTDVFMPGIKKGITETQQAIFKSRTAGNKGAHIAVGDTSTPEGRGQVNAVRLARARYKHTADKDKFINDTITSELNDYNEAQLRHTELQKQKTSDEQLLNDYATILLGGNSNKIGTAGFQQSDLRKLEADFLSDTSKSDAEKQQLELIVKNQTWKGAEKVQERLANIDTEITVANKREAKAKTIYQNAFDGSKVILEDNIKKLRNMSPRQQELARKFIDSEYKKLEETLTKVKKLAEDAVGDSMTSNYAERDKKIAELPTQAQLNELITKASLNNSTGHSKDLKELKKAIETAFAKMGMNYKNHK